MEARIPFAGFYESKWSAGVDSEEEQYFESLKEEHSLTDEDMGEMQEWMWRHARYHRSYLHIAQEYVSPFQDFINEGLGLSIKLTYKDMSSPREYNFETDKIVVEISYEDAIKLARRVGRNALRKAAKDMFTSRDGFISFYRNDPAEWGRLRGWDWNHMYCLFQAAVDVIGEEDYEWPIYEDFSGNGHFGEAFYRAFDEKELLLEVGKIVGKRELKEELEEQAADEDRLFPVAYTDTADYVRRYEEMNAGAYGGAYAAIAAIAAKSNSKEL